jgi:hypothetical protein
MALRLFFLTILLLPAGHTALVGARLGGTIDDFKSQWGSPSREEVLGRTARLVWHSAGQKRQPTPLPTSETEVSFVKRIACEVVLRLKHPPTKHQVAELGRALVPDFSEADLSIVKSMSGGGKTYELTTGGHVTVWAKARPSVVIIRSKLFLRNQDLFDREAAKVRPPTANH